MQSVEESGVGVSWYKTELPQGEYQSSWGGEGTKEVVKQFAGHFTLKSGGQVSIRPHTDSATPCRHFTDTISRAGCSDPSLPEIAATLLATIHKFRACRSTATFLAIKHACGPHNSS